MGLHPTDRRFRIHSSANFRFREVAVGTLGCVRAALMDQITVANQKQGKLGPNSVPNALSREDRIDKKYGEKDKKFALVGSNLELGNFCREFVHGN
jgi:hypothetical protein